MHKIDLDDVKIKLPRALFELTLYFYTNSKHLKLEGLFRKSGSQPAIEKLNTHLIFCDYLIMTESEVKDQPHDVANLIKNILRELDAPLVPYNLFHEMLEKCKKGIEPQERKQQLRDILLKCPELNKTTLAWIIMFMKDVAAKEKYNKMSQENINLIFANNLFRLSQTAEAISELAFLTPKMELVRLMMEDSNFIFGTDLMSKLGQCKNCYKK